MEGQLGDTLFHESLEYYGRVREEKGISIVSMTREVIEGLVIYTAIGTMNGRQDSASGAENIEGLTGLAKANAFKSAETQAKSRLTISLSACPRYKAPEGPAVPEPVVQVAPQVNQAPAAVVADIRVLPIVEVTKVELAETSLPIPEVVSILIPTVSESQIASIHREAEAQDKQFTADVRFNAAVAASLVEQPDMFAEPEVAFVPPPPPLAAPAPVVDAVLAACQPTTPTGVTMPVPIAPPTDQPTRLQYQAFTVRCTKLVRDKLPKAGKEAASALLPYLKKLFGTKELTPESTSITLWESTLAKLEAATPADALLILKGK